MSNEDQVRFTMEFVYTKSTGILDAKLVEGKPVIKDSVSLPIAALTETQLKQISPTVKVSLASSNPSFCVIYETAAGYSMECF